MAEDFSASEGVGRRRFLSGIIGVVAGAVAVLVGVPAVGYIVSPGVKKPTQEEWLTLGPLSGLTPGTPMGFPYSLTFQDGWVQSTKTGVAYALTLDGQSCTVFSDVCTHLGCRVSWKADRAVFLCPCHDGIFSATGAIISGPQPRPLDQFVSRIESGQIQIKVEA